MSESTIWAIFFGVLVAIWLAGRIVECVWRNTK